MHTCNQAREREKPSNRRTVVSSHQTHVKGNVKEHFLRVNKEKTTTACYYATAKISRQKHTTQHINKKSSVILLRPASLVQAIPNAMQACVCFLSEHADKFWRKQFLLNWL